MRSPFFSVSIFIAAAIIAPALLPLAWPLKNGPLCDSFARIWQIFVQKACKLASIVTHILVPKWPPFFWGVDIFIDVWVNLFAFVVGSWCIYFSFAPLSDSDCSHFLNHGPWLFKKSSKGNHWLIFWKTKSQGQFFAFFISLLNGERSKILQHASKSHSSFDFSGGSKNVLELDPGIVAFRIFREAHLNTQN